MSWLPKCCAEHGVTLVKAGLLPIRSAARQVRLPGERIAALEVGPCFGKSFDIVRCERLVIIRRVHERLEHGVRGGAATEHNEFQEQLDRPDSLLGQLVYETMQSFSRRHASHSLPGRA